MKGSDCSQCRAQIFEFERGQGRAAREYRKIGHFDRWAPDHHLLVPNAETTSQYGCSKG